jgi:hypothetical protein
MLPYFGLDCGGILQMFYSRAVLQRTIVDSSTFLEPGLAEKIAGLSPNNPSAEEIGGIDGFLYKTAQNFEVFSNIQG